MYIVSNVKFGFQNNKEEPSNPYQLKSIPIKIDPE